jgi:hypothetical protein
MLPKREGEPQQNQKERGITKERKKKDLKQKEKPKQDKEEKTRWRNSRVYQGQSGF